MAARGTGIVTLSGEARNSMELACRLCFLRCRRWCKEEVVTGGRGAVAWIREGKARCIQGGRIRRSVVMAAQSQIERGLGKRCRLCTSATCVNALLFRYPLSLCLSVSALDSVRRGTRSRRADVRCSQDCQIRPCPVLARLAAGPTSAVRITRT